MKNNDLRDLLNKAPFMSYYEFMELVYQLSFEAESSFANINDLKQIENGISKIGIERIVNFDMDSPWDQFYAEKKIMADEISATIDFISDIHIQIGAFDEKKEYHNRVLENLKPLSSMKYFERIVSYITGKNFSELLELIIELVDFDNENYQKVNPAYKLRLFQSYSESDISKLISSLMKKSAFDDEIKNYIEIYKENILNEIIHKTNILINIFRCSVDGDSLRLPMQYLYYYSSQNDSKSSAALIQKFNTLPREVYLNKGNISDEEINALMSE